jgi:hypothetical protein
MGCNLLVVDLFACDVFGLDATDSGLTTLYSSDLLHKPSAVCMSKVSLGGTVFQFALIPEQDLSKTVDVSVVSAHTISVL